MEGVDARSVGLRVALVSRARVAENFRILCGDGNAGMIVDLPADAFGHGLEEAAATLVDAGARHFGVSRLRDAVRLRESGVTSQVTLWTPAPSDDLRIAAELDIAIAVGSLAAFRSAVSSGARSVWLSIGTAPGVETLSHGDAVTLLLTLAAEATGAGLRVSLHLAGDGVDVLESMLAVASDASVTIESLATGLLEVPLPARPDLGVPMLGRVGAEVFGLSETLEPTTAATRPALSLVATVIAVKDAPAGVGVSYGYTYRTRTDTRIALVPVGYGDGIDRSAGNTGQVLLGGVRYTIAGRVAMDASVLDIGAADVTVGDVVEVLGDPASGAPSAQDWGSWLGVPSAAIVSGLTARVERRWV
jgi:alanine racemase